MISEIKEIINGNIKSQKDIQENLENVENENSGNIIKKDNSNDSNNYEKKIYNKDNNKKVQMIVILKNQF